MSAADLKTWDALAALRRMNKTLAGKPPGPDVDQLIAVRTEKLVTVNAVTTELAERSAMVRILVPDLDDVVEALWDAYRAFPDGDFQAQERAHHAARAAFEKQARALLSF